MLNSSPKQRMTEGRCTRQELTRLFLCMAVVSFLLHSVWEMSQMAAYRDLAGRPLLETIARCTPATLGDVVLTFWIYGIAALAAYSIGWGLRSRWNVYLSLGLLGLGHAIWIEQVALASGRWSYSDAMPRIPRLDVGIWPLLQLTLLTPVTVWISSRFALRRRACPTSSKSNLPPSL